jgi:hypothetical protein
LLVIALGVFAVNRMTVIQMLELSRQNQLDQMRTLINTRIKDGADHWRPCVFREQARSYSGVFRDLR